MSETTYYKRNREIISNRAKYFYEKNRGIKEKRKKQVQKII